MAAEKKLESPVTLFAAVEAKQHEALRELAFREKRSLADIVREALAEYIKARTKKGRLARV
ncbi:MAG: ribbon-helix-helix protein, CopG family [Thermoanaerobaculia bacterium]